MGSSLKQICVCVCVCDMVMMRGWGIPGFLHEAVDRCGRLESKLFCWPNPSFSSSVWSLFTLHSSAVPSWFGQQLTLLPWISNIGWDQNLDSSKHQEGMIQWIFVMLDFLFVVLGNPQKTHLIWFYYLDAPWLLLIFIRIAYKCDFYIMASSRVQWKQG